MKADHGRNRCRFVTAALLAAGLTLLFSAGITGLQDSYAGEAVQYGCSPTGVMSPVKPAGPLKSVGNDQDSSSPDPQDVSKANSENSVSPSDSLPKQESEALMSRVELARAPEAGDPFFERVVLNKMREAVSAGDGRSVKESSRFAEESFADLEKAEQTDGVAGAGTAENESPAGTEGAFSPAAAREAPGSGFSGTVLSAETGLKYASEGKASENALAPPVGGLVRPTLGLMLSANRAETSNQEGKYSNLARVFVRNEAPEARQTSNSPFSKERDFNPPSRELAKALTSLNLTGNSTTLSADESDPWMVKSKLLKKWKRYWYLKYLKLKSRGMDSFSARFASYRKLRE